MCTEQTARARQTTASATANANARCREAEELRVAIARLAMSTMAGGAAQNLLRKNVNVHHCEEIISVSTALAQLLRDAMG